MDLDHIPARFIGWDRRRGFYDKRQLAAERLALALQRCGLAHLIDVRGWIRYNPDRLVCGCLFNEALWLQVKARAARKDAAARAKAGRPGPRARTRVQRQAAQTSSPIDAP